MADESTSTVDTVDAPETDAQDFDKEWDRLTTANDDDAGDDANTAPKGDDDDGVTDPVATGDDDEPADKAGDDEPAAKAKDGDDEPDEATKRAAEQEAGEKWWDTVRKVHPNALDVVKDARFQQWLAGQPKAVQSDANSQDDPLAAAGVLTAYNAALASGDVPEVEAGGADAEMADWLKAVGLDRLKISDEDGEHSLVDAAKTYDVIDATYKMIRAAQRELRDEMKALKGAIPDVAGINAKLADYDVLQSHPDANKIAKTKVFAEYLDKQPASFQKLWKQGSSEDRIAFMDRYKADRAREKGGAGADADAARRGLHQSTMRGSDPRGKSTSTDGDAADDDPAAFDAEFERLAREAREKK